MAIASEEQKLRMRIYHITHKKERQAYKKELYQRNAEQLKAKQRQYNLDHAEEKRERQHEYYRETIEARKAYEKHRRTTDAFKARMSSKKTRDYALKSKYGLTQVDYEALLLQQGNACAACQATEPGSKRQFFDVDHCHKSGRVRGLLCTRCNKALGHANDSIEILEGLIRYLKSSTEVANESRSANS